MGFEFGNWLIDAITFVCIFVGASALTAAILIPMWKRGW